MGRWQPSGCLTGVGGGQARLTIALSSTPTIREGGGDGGMKRWKKLHAHRPLGFWGSCDGHPSRRQTKSRHRGRCSRQMALNYVNHQGSSREGKFSRLASIVCDGSLLFSSKLPVAMTNLQSLIQALIHFPIPAKPSSSTHPPARCTARSIASCTTQRSLWPGAAAERHRTTRATKNLG